MRGFNYIILLIAGVIICGYCAIAQGAATTSDFERYRAIMDANPFGQADPPEPVDVPTNQPSEVLNKELEMKAIIEDENGMRVGFLDKKTKEIFFLTVGEELDSYELVSVDYENEEAILRKGTELSIFMLTPKKGRTNAVHLPRRLPGMRTLSSPIPRPLFSQLKKRKLPTAPSPFRSGSTPGIPYRGETIENFLKEHPEAIMQFPNPVRPTTPSGITPGMGATIERFLKSNPDATRRFSPFIPVNTTMPDGTVPQRGALPPTFPSLQPQSTEQSPLPSPDVEIYEEYYIE